MSWGTSGPVDQRRKFNLDVKLPHAVGTQRDMLVCLGQLGQGVYHTDVDINCHAKNCYEICWHNYIYSVIRNVMDTKWTTKYAMVKLQVFMHLLDNSNRICHPNRWNSKGLKQQILGYVTKKNITLDSLLCMDDVFLIHAPQPGRTPANTRHNEPCGQ